jgi:hypothetical protein
MDQPPDTVIPQFVYPKPSTICEEEGGSLPIQSKRPAKGMQLSPPTPNHLDERPLWLNMTPQLNSQQLTAVKVGIALLVLMGIFPPWRHTFSMSLGGDRFHSERPADYYAIFAPPKPPEDLIAIGWTTNIDFGRLVLQWVVVAVATFGGIFLLGQTKTSDTFPPSTSAPSAHDHKERKPYPFSDE